MLDLVSKFGRVVKKHLREEYFVWLTTVDAKGTPQPRPVWFIWEADAFLIFSQAHAYKIKHLENNPRVSLHFNTEDDHGDQHVIVFTGEAEIDAAANPAYRVRAYMRKYKNGIASLKMTPEEFSHEYSRAIRIEPSQVRGWE